MSVLSRYDHKQQAYLYAAYLKEFNQGVGPLVDFLSKQVRKFNKICFVLLGAYACNVDLMGGHEAERSPISDSMEIYSSAARKIEELEHAAPGRRPQAASGRQEKDKKKSDGFIRADVHKRARLSMLIAKLITWMLPRQRSSWMRNLKRAWIRDSIQILYATAVAYMSLSVAYLYKYHIDSLRINRLRDLIREHGSARLVALDNDLPSALISSTDSLAEGGLRNTTISGGILLMSLEDFKKILETRANETREFLSYLGDSFIETGMINEIGYLGTLFLGLNLFVGSQLLYLYTNPPGTRLHRDLIDAKEEERRVNACCEAEVLKYLDSNRAHAAVLLTRSNQFYLTNQYEHEHQGDKLKVVRQTRYRYRGSVGEKPRLGLPPPYDPHDRHDLIASDYHTCSSLMRLLLSGALRPLNSSERWRAHMNLTAAFFILEIPTFCALFLCGVAIVTGTIGDFITIKLDVTFLLILVVLNTAAGTFNTVSLVIASVEQVALVRRSLRAIYDCCRLNRLLFNTFIARDIREQPKILVADQRFAIIDKINSNYLFAWMTYKIFVAQLAPFKRTFRGVFTAAFSLAFLVPALARIHLPYLLENEQETRKFRLACLVVGMSFLIPLNAICLPMCYLHAHCRKLYPALSSLNAHIIEVREHSAGAEGIYNEHSVRILQKELAVTELMLQQFNVQSHGMSGTYSTLLRLHFWWGLAALSILIDTKNNSEDILFGNFFNDPLGVWRFRLV